MRKACVAVWLVTSTVILSLFALFVALFGDRQETIHSIGRLWSRMFLAVAGIEVRIEGLDRISSPPYVFMCNHQSALDIHALMARLPVSFKWIAKRQLFAIPLFGWALKKAGYVSIDRENPREALKAMDEASRRIREGTNIVIFPEGTRSADGKLLPFKKGGFTLALRAMVPVVPIGIYGSSALQPKGSSIPGKKGVIYIEIGDPIVLEGMDRSQKTRVMENVRVDIEALMAKGESAQAGFEGAPAGH
ncbi:MAG: 1-acyl-sn-glycerol-3-phosphate acyltransferase [Deltaproteobacteria bacterium]|nr:1-acyl-sn-glycerol-3-phosphate acyltransferase [Deltaproteobacteria bacterium]